VTLIPLRGCPGRWVVADADARTRTPHDLFGVTDVSTYVVPGARDPVLVARLPDGRGVISYARADGTYCHTVGSPEGFARKLGTLGIPIKPHM
jgi:hypothetical protein